MAEQTTGMLVLEDGSTFTGQSVGADGEFVGEVVFNTSMTGYQEIITDPSYWGQMVTFTCPHIGNVGINGEDAESAQPYVRAVLARQICERPSNWRSQQSLPEYLQMHGVPALTGVDTRRLTLTLRERGVMRGALSTSRPERERLYQMARSAPDLSDLSVLQYVSCPQMAPWTAALPPAWQPDLGDGGPQADSAFKAGAERPHVVVLDCGIKYNILRHLVEHGARVTVVPYTTTLAEIAAFEPDGVLLGNGPGDPRQVPQPTLETVAQVLERWPTLGICLGHQLIALAGGARIYKLPFGHHGGNHPVQALDTGAIEITAQNHNYAVEPDSLRGLPFEVTRLNLNDRTIEGLRHRALPIISVQYHPEASPGPHDGVHLLRQFVHSLKPATASYA